MSYETIPIEAKDAISVYVLTGQLTAVDEDAGTVDVNIDGHGSFSDVPVFYHCQNKDTADGMPFIDGVNDRVVIVNSGDPVDLSVADMKVVGFEDGLPRECPVETVLIELNEQCFVWDVAQNQYAEVKTNSGILAEFPCDPDDISDWKDKQTYVGNNLFNDYGCGRKLFYAPELACGGAEWGTAGNSSDSVSEPSSCLNSFNDTGECSGTWDLTEKCYPSGGSWWVYAGPSTIIETHNILWEGFHDEERSPQKLYFQNNCDIQDAFRVERTHNKNEAYWSSEGGGGGSGCFNIRLDSGEYVDNYKIHTPIALNLLELNSVSSMSWDLFNNLGAQAQADYLTELKFVSYGEYSDKTITQAYIIEARTVNRTADCCMNYYGSCRGVGCVGDECPWIDETFTRHGVEVAAQIGFITGGTDGIDPTSLQRNNAFEEAVKATYEKARSVAVIQDDELLGIDFNVFIYKGPL